MRRSVWLSGLIFVALLALTWWAFRQRGGEPDQPYFSLQRRIPDTLTVIHRGDTTTVVTTREGGWELIRPVVYPADGLVVEAMLTRLTPLPVLRTFPLLPEKMDTYGMRFPRGWIRAAYRDELSPDTLWIGGWTMNATLDYVRAGSREEVGLVDDRLVRSYLLKTTIEIRDTRLMPFPASRARSLVLLDPDLRVRIRLEQDEGGGWAVGDPYPGPADPQKTREYLKSVAHMHIREFITEGPAPPEPYGLDSPQCGIRVRVTDGEELGFVLGDSMPETDQLYAKSSAHPHILAVSDKYLSVLSRPADYFRQTALFPFGLSVVESVTVQTSSLQNTRTVPRGEDTNRIRERLGGLVQLRAVAFEKATPERLARRGLDPPQGRVIWRGETDTLAVLDLGKVAKDLRALRVSGGIEARREEILLVSEVEIGPLWDALRDPGTP